MRCSFVIRQTWASFGKCHKVAEADSSSRRRNKLHSSECTCVRYIYSSWLHLCRRRLLWRCLLAEQRLPSTLLGPHHFESHTKALLTQFQMKSIKKRSTALRCRCCCYFAHIVLHTHTATRKKRQLDTFVLRLCKHRTYLAELVQNLPKMNKYVIMRAPLIIVIVFVAVAVAGAGASGRQRRHLHLRATSALATKFRTTQEQRRRRVATSPTRGSRLTALLRRGLCQNVAAAAATLGARECSRENTSVEQRDRQGSSQSSPRQRRWAETPQTGCCNWMPQTPCLSWPIPPGRLPHLAAALLLLLLCRLSTRRPNI